MLAQPKIRIRNLSKRYAGNANATLHDLSLDIAAGSFFTLFGPSGCGKSTLLRCLAGLETPDKGEIHIGDKVVFSSITNTVVPPNQRQLGMVFQSYAIWPHMTVIENVVFPLKVQRKPNPVVRAQEALKLVELDHLADRYASNLSGGQQQRVALARAIVADPAVLLLDEPLSNLDAALRSQMRAELGSLQKRLGVTAIYVTHDHTEALSMSDQIAVMQEGRFVEVGSPHDLYYTPKSAFAAKLIGGANIIEGDAKSIDGNLTIVSTLFGSLLSTDGGVGPVQIFVRPERIGLIAANAPVLQGPNVIRCRVRERRFEGDNTEFDLVTDTASGILRCRASTSETIGPGDEVSAIIDPSDIRIFPRSNTAI